MDKLTTPVIITSNEDAVKFSDNILFFASEEFYYLKMSAGNVPLKGKEFKNWLLIQLEKKYNITFKHVSYFKKGNNIFIEGITHKLQGDKVIPLGLYVFWDYLKNFSYKPCIYLLKDIYSEKTTIIGCSLEGIKIYRQVSVEEVESTVNEVYTYLARIAKREIDEITLCSNYENISEENIKFFEIKSPDNIPDTLYYINKKKFPLKTICISFVTIILGLFLIFNITFLEKLLYSSYKYRKLNKIFNEVQNYNSIFLSKRNDLKVSCIDYFNPDRDLPIQIKSLYVDNRICSFESNLYSFSRLNTERIKKELQRLGGDFHVIKKKDFYKIIWKYNKNRKIGNKEILSNFFGNIDRMYNQHGDLYVYHSRQQKIKHQNKGYKEFSGKSFFRHIILSKFRDLLHKWQIGPAMVYAATKDLSPMEVANITNSKQTRGNKSSDIKSNSNSHMEKFERNFKKARLRTKNSLSPTKINRGTNENLSNRFSKNSKIKRQIYENKIEEDDLSKLHINKWLKQEINYLQRKVKKLTKDIKIKDERKKIKIIINPDNISLIGFGRKKEKTVIFLGKKDLIYYLTEDQPISLNGNIFYLKKIDRNGKTVVFTNNNKQIRLYFLPVSFKASIKLPLDVASRQNKNKSIQHIRNKIKNLLKSGN